MPSIPFSKTDITGGFWKRIQDRTREVTIGAVYDRFCETGRISAFKFNWKEGMPNRPHIFWDSDVAKWMEGAANVLAKHPDPELMAKVEELIDDIEKNQDENGYFNIYFTVCEPDSRFTRRADHELYCAGHLFEAAAAYYDATGRDRFLKLMCRYADHIEKVFKTEGSAAFDTCGHEEIELALVRLFRVTGERRYLELAAHFVNMRGMSEKDGDFDFSLPCYDQRHLPVRLQETAQGHSVRACYLYSAMADLAGELGDRELFSACEKIFDNITAKRMYITGGVGSSHVGEAFTMDFDLPNKTAYAETCAAVSLAFFARRMQDIALDSKYADIVERTLFNGILSGISLDGRAFFYENPLEIDPGLADRDVSVKKNRRPRTPATQRAQVFSCSCCPPNLCRLFPSVGEYAYGREGETYFIHQYMESRMRDGGAEISVTTDYPISGEIRIRTAGISRLALRIPGWCKKFSLDREFRLEKGYAYLDPPEGEISLRLETEPVFMLSSPKIGENAGRAALALGPIVYCLEAADNGPGLKSLIASGELGFSVEYDEFFGANVICANGLRPADPGTLYFPAGQEEYEPVRLKFIPYFGFANRGESEMLVWVRHRG